MPSWVPDQETKPAPMPLLLVQSFVNTWDGDHGSDLLLVIRDAQHDGSWQRLKACGNPDCRWAFYDRSHSRAGAWCDMATCGNRIKNRRLRQRQR